MYTLTFNIITKFAPCIENGGVNMTGCLSNFNTITSRIAEKFKMVLKFDSLKEKTNTLCSWNMTQTCDSMCCS